MATVSDLREGISSHTATAAAITAMAVTISLNVRPVIMGHEISAGRSPRNSTIALYPSRSMRALM